jgi:hypothetical protein
MFAVRKVKVNPGTEVTTTYLTPFVLATIRQANHLAHAWKTSSVSQMPVVRIPIHFDSLLFQSIDHEFYIGYFVSPKL